MKSKQHKIRSFALREGRFTKAQREAIKNLLPIYGLRARHAVPLQFKAETILEIGFGMGNTLVAMAQNAPDKNFIGVEVFRSGIGSICKQIHARGLKNLRIIYHDAVEVLENNILDSSLSGVQIFFPDPWPKRRHHKRRLIQPEFVELIRKKLKPGGFLHLATDWEDYARHMEKILAHASGWRRSNPAERPITKFEQRGKKLNHQIWEIMVVKL